MGDTTRVREPRFPEISLALDMDQVMNHFEKRVKFFLDLHFRGQVQFKEFHEMKFWDHSQNYSNEVNNYLRRLFQNPPENFYARLEPVQDIVSIVNWLQSQVTVWIVSNPLSESSDTPMTIEKLVNRDAIWCRVVEEKKIWLRKVFRENTPRFLPTDKKEIFHGNIIIDDRPDAFDPRLNPDLIHILYDNNYLFNKYSNHEFRLHWGMDWQSVVQEAIFKVVKAKRKNSSGEAG